MFEDLGQIVVKDMETGHLIVRASPACKAQINEMTCGHGTFVVSGKQLYVGNEKQNYYNGKSWDQIKAESILVPAEESYAPIAAYIIDSCKKMNCEDSVDRFKVKLDSLAKKK